MIKKIVELHTKELSAIDGFTITENNVKKVADHWEVVLDGDDHVYNVYDENGFDTLLSDAIESSKDKIVARIEEIWDFDLSERWFRGDSQAIARYIENDDVNALLDGLDSYCHSNMDILNELNWEPEHLLGADTVIDVDGIFFVTQY